MREDMAVLAIGLAFCFFGLGLLSAPFLTHPNHPQIPDSARDFFEISSVTFSSENFDHPKLVLVKVHAITPTTLQSLTVYATHTSAIIISPRFKLSYSWNETTTLSFSFSWEYEQEYRVIVRAERRRLDTTVVAPKKPVIPLYSIKCAIPAYDNATHAEWQLNYKNQQWNAPIKTLPMSVNVTLGNDPLWQYVQVTLTVTYYKEAAPGMFERLCQKTFYVQVTVTYD
jgi:hypothetical protein